MKIAFTKMTGAGNDFVVIDNRSKSIALDSEKIQKLCDRYFGVGADGVLAVEPGEQGADFRMRYYNADGGEAEMCGNGTRCFARFVQPWIKKETVSFMTMAGLIRARYVGDEVEINMTRPTDLKPGQILSTTLGKQTVHSINTGVPHAVLFVEDLAQAPVFELGRELRYHEAFAPKGTNVNFAKVTGPQRIDVRTYERGVENETLACGTGVTAAAILANYIKKMPTPILVGVKSQRVLKINFKSSGDNFEDVTMQGPAEFIFQGEITV